MIVYKGDVKVVRRLGQDYLRSCKVAKWQCLGRDRWRPEAWIVEDARIAQEGLAPLDEAAAMANRRNVSRGVREARRKEWQACGGDGVNYQHWRSI